MAVVLIIEDNADLADTIQACVEAAGYSSHWAETGERGLEMCQQLEPELIILDCNLPGMDGIKVCIHVRHLELKQYPYILMLTARRDQTHEIHALTVGADDYMTKPFDPDLLIARLRALLRRNRYENCRA